MPMTRHVKLSDVRSMLRLGEEVYHAPDNASRKQKLLQGLCRLVRARMGVCVVTHLDRRSRRRTVLSVVSTADESAPHMSTAWAAPERAEVFSGDAPSGVDEVTPLTSATESAGSDDDWVVRPSRGPTTSCIRSSVDVGQSGVAATIRICCDRDRFTARERTLVNLVHLEMGWIYRADVPLASPGTAGLSPRQRQTLELLLAGEGEKQIASKLKLSQNTIHHYVKALYRHFQVSSRSELLSKWVGGAKSIS